MKPSNRLNHWRQFEAANEYERNRVKFLKFAPLPKNDQRLFELVKVRIIKPFYSNGVLQTPEMGIILIGRFDAEDLQSICTT